MCCLHPASENWDGALVFSLSSVSGRMMKMMRVKSTAWPVATEVFYVDEHCLYESQSPGGN